MSTKQIAKQLLYHTEFEAYEPRLMMAAEPIGEVPIEQFAGADLDGDRQIELLAAEPGAFISSAEHPWMPNPVFGSTFRSSLGGGIGLWSDPISWSTGRVPTANDRVIIAAGDEVVIRDTNAIAHSIGVYEGGKLSFATDADTHLKVITLLVLGELEVGSGANPVLAHVQAKITLRDAPWDLQEDPMQYGHGLIAAGNARVRMHGQIMTETFVPLASAPQAGDTTLVLARPVLDWHVGDSLILPDSRAEIEGASDDDAQWERPRITAISEDGRTLTLNKPLQIDHPAWSSDEDALPHVGNLSRNVAVKSENGSPNTDEQGLSRRGYTLFTGRADVDIRYTQFRLVGRTTTAPIDNTTWDENGQITHVGTNQDGRFPVSFDHLLGPETPQIVYNVGYQFTFLFNAIGCPFRVHGFKWGIAIDSSDEGVIQDNVLYNWDGAGIALSDGSEIANSVERNFIVRSDGTGVVSEVLSGNEGWGVWARGGDNIIKDNLAVNVDAKATITGGNSLTDYGVFRARSAARRNGTSDRGLDQLRTAFRSEDSRFSRDAQSQRDAHRTNQRLNRRAARSDNLGSGVSSAIVTGLSSHPQYWFSIGTHGTAEGQSSATTTPADRTASQALREDGVVGFDVDRIAARLKPVTAASSALKKQALPLLDRVVDEAIAQLQALSTGDLDAGKSDSSAIEVDAAEQEALSFYAVRDAD